MKRVKGAVFVQPIVYGSVSTWQGPDADQFKAHHWYIFVRGLYHEDLSYFVDHVEFVLHETLQPPVRIVREPPYEIEDYGWGEFEVIIRIHFKDKLEKPADMYHMLKLFSLTGEKLTTTPVVSDHYDELVFIEPPEKLLSILEKGTDKKVTSALGKFTSDFIAQEQEDTSKVQAARRLVQAHSHKLQGRLEELDKEAALLRYQVD
ncbi:Transcription initiation factor TFIID subunit 14b [Porphyridium purpureum]|uniref:Transcription initiation factor TFIID subunit 14b n=1 Tax=Porphyridium purpureum TaxID=35688 RepID=A0A5J4YYX1_PORPP|nr:Transcription initiation factor TFIID subunit 14b [Porphyridium purpureum]|eukprot:POR6333..scf208_2